MKILSTTGKVLALLFAAAFVVVFPFTLITYNVQQHLMQPELYKNALVEQEAYQQIPDLLAAELEKTAAQADPEAGDMGQQALTEMLQSLSREDWRYILDNLLPKGWAQAKAEGVLDALFAFLEGETNSLDVRISLVPLKENLEGPQGNLVLERLVDALPACTEDDLFRFLLDTLTGAEPNLPVCAPPPELLGENMETLEFLLPLAAEQIPENISVQLNVEDFDMPTTGTLAGQSNLVLLYRQTRQAFQWSLAVSFALLLLVALLAVRSVRGIAGWWGWPLTLGSAVVLVPLFANRSQVAFRLVWFISERIPDVVSPGVYSLLDGVIRRLSETLLDALQTHALIFFILGIAMLVIGRALKPQKEKSSTEELPAEEEETE